MFREAFSSGGYIVRQRLCDDMPYGRVTTAQSGCAAIAAYNISRLFGLDCPWEEIRDKLQKSVILGGRCGTAPGGLRRWLGERFLLKSAFRPERAARLADASRAGVILYWHGNGAHYVAYENRGETLHFYNVCSAAPEVDCTMKDFIKNNSKIPLIYILTLEGLL